MSSSLCTNANDTIAAIATAPGEGGVAIVRISGAEAIRVASALFSGPVDQYKTHTAHYGKVRDLEGRHVDDVLLLVMKGPRSYTGEDVVELHCHGGKLITKKVLQTALAAGARLALPGEFSQRAVLNGKIDLVQAEAVQALIGAKNEKALAIAEQHLEGRLSREIHRFKAILLEVGAILEASVDFPEEGLEFATPAEINTTLQLLRNEIEHLINTFERGKIAHQGASLGLVGRPNVGKSSLMNLLLNHERAIVSAVPGTTRDLIEDDLHLNGMHFKLKDSAGIRDNPDPIEEQGILRAKALFHQADLLLMVLSAEEGVTPEDLQILEQLPQEKTIVIWNKVDLVPGPALPDVAPFFTVRMSVKHALGVEALAQAVDQVLWRGHESSADELMITQIRHFEGLRDAHTAISAVVDGLSEQRSPEFLTSDLRASIRALNRIIGGDLTEDLLSTIFSKFCLGK